MARIDKDFQGDVNLMVTLPKDLQPAHVDKDGQKWFEITPEVSLINDPETGLPANPQGLHANRNPAIVNNLKRDPQTGDNYNSHKMLVSEEVLNKIKEGPDSAFTSDATGKEYGRTYSFNANLVPDPNGNKNPQFKLDNSFTFDPDSIQSGPELPANAYKAQRDRKELNKELNPPAIYGKTSTMEQMREVGPVVGAKQSPEMAVNEPPLGVAASQPDFGSRPDMRGFFQNRSERSGLSAADEPAFNSGVGSSASINPFDRLAQIQGKNSPTMERFAPQGYSAQDFVVDTPKNPFGEVAKDSTYKNPFDKGADDPWADRSM